MIPTPHPVRTRCAPRPRAAAAGALAGLLLLTSAATAAAPVRPASPVADVELFAKSLELAQAALDQYGATDDRAALRRVADVGYRVARESGFTAYPLTFHLIDMPEPNAFALPGGQLFLTRGMLDLELSDDMLAGLLGHEIAHVVLDHHGRMQRRATWMNVLSQALLIGVAVGAEGSRKGGASPYYNPNDSPGGNLIEGAAVTSLVVSELLLRSFSREHEDEADEEGQRWAAAAGFSPTGTGELMDRMGQRLPQDKKYGYWRTHPFFDERVRAARVRAELLRRQPGHDDADYRRRTQEALLAVREDAKIDAKGKPLLRAEALTAWPRGEAAEKLRLERLHELRDAELARDPLARDFGLLERSYAQEAAEVAELAADSALLATLTAERAEFTAQAAALYPQAVEILRVGIYETAFLERFVSNWPQAPEVPRAALLLGDARARLGDPTDAIANYLRAWDAAPTSPEGERAATGLRNLAPTLTQLAALAQLAEQRRDPELARRAAERLDQVAATFSDLDNGAEYLRRYPEGAHLAPVTARINELADNLYAEVVLYQAIGDHAKAVERIHRILTQAPLSPAAELLRERAEVRA